MITAVVSALLLAASQDSQGSHGIVPFRTDIERALRDAQFRGKPVWILGSASW